MPRSHVPPGRWRILGTLDETSGAGHGLETLVRSNTPEKSVAYLRERYVRHPWFQYQCLILGDDHGPGLVAVVRELEHDGATALRVVDLVGRTDLIDAGAEALASHLASTSAEYLEIPAYGLDRGAMARAGFHDRAAHEGLVVPTRFSPFEARTIDMAVSLQLGRPHPGLHLHPADSDQDRPNA